MPQDQSYCEVPLTTGGVALVDSSDFERVSQWKWFARQKGTVTYAFRTKDGMRMHRFVMGLVAGDERKVDHIEPAETLNNRRSNLRFATTTENARNHRKLEINCTSKLKGVYFHRKNRRWVAQIVVDLKTVYLGSFPNEEAAHHAYCEAAKTLHGKFARLS